MRVAAAFVFSVVIAVLAGCSGSHSVSALPMRVASGPSAYPLINSGYKSLYSFKPGKDGANPYAGLTPLDGTLYGTTGNGGSGCGACGTVFKVSTSGEEHVLFSFRGRDGEKPMAGLVAFRGTLYGTTTEGTDRPGCVGSSDECGTVFAISTSGKERVLHRFTSATDGAYPSAPLIVVNGMLYGTTPFGGTKNRGTVFAVSTSGEEHIVYSFKGGMDSEYPFAGLIAANGALYGTTGRGGDSRCNRITKGCGTVFKVSTTGDEHVLYRFTGRSDGAYPLAGLIMLNGKLYGTTEAGGGSSNCHDGCGTIFDVSTSGEERVLYRFRGPPDGAYPMAPLVPVNDTLYGTTSSGGTGCSGSGSYGCGTVFSVSTTGKEHVLYRFNGIPTDGSGPNAGLVILDGMLYGTTAYGGTNYNEGTVFRISP